MDLKLKGKTALITRRQRRHRQRASRCALAQGRRRCRRSARGARSRSKPRPARIAKDNRPQDRRHSRRPATGQGRQVKLHRAGPQGAPVASTSWSTMPARAAGGVIEHLTEDDWEKSLPAQSSWATCAACATYAADHGRSRAAAGVVNLIGNDGVKPSLLGNLPGRGQCQRART